MDSINYQQDVTDEPEDMEEEPTPVASDEFESPAADELGKPEFLQIGSMDDMEPSLELQFPPCSPEEPLAEVSSFIPGDDIEFPSSRNSPDIPGASSMLLNRWEPREADHHHSPHSETSFHSSIYPVASIRTSMTGGVVPEPRSLVKSSEGKIGLETGDVIMLKYQGTPYVAIKQMLPYKDDAWHHCLELLTEEKALESEGMAYLEVVKQGSYVGFRSGAAGNRFVQPRRKAPHRLVFFNQNCGVWEQWDVLGDNWRSAPWSSLPMVFRNRRLPQVQLAVDVVRVGFYVTAGGMGGTPFAPTPRSLLPAIPEEGHVEDTNLRRISNVLVLEWLKFVDNEKMLRQGLEANLEALQEEMAQLKVNTIRQVEYLRLQMSEEMAALGVHVSTRDTLISMLRNWLRRTQQLAANGMARTRHRRILMAWRYVVDNMVYYNAVIVKLTRKRQDELREKVFRAWQLRARGSAGAANKQIAAVERRSHAIMKRVLVGWQRVLAHRAWRARVVVAAVQRRSALRMSTTFSAWRDLTVQRAVGRGALQRALHGVSQAWLAAALMAWRAATLAARRNDVQADLMAERRVARVAATAFFGWQDVVGVRRAADRLACKSLLRYAFGAWRDGVSAAQLRASAADAMAAERPLALRRSVLDAWREITLARGALQQRLERHVAHRSFGLQARVLAEWGLAAGARRRQRALLRRHQAAVGARTAAAVLVGWHAVVARTAWRQSRMITAVSRTSARRMSAVFTFWRAYASDRAAVTGRGSLLAVRIRRMRLGALMAGWRHIAARVRAGRHILETIAGRLEAGFMSSVFTEWRLLARTAAASRFAAARALPPDTRALLMRFLGKWWARHCDTPTSLDSMSSSFSARMRASLSTSTSASKAAGVASALESADAAHVDPSARQLQLQHLQQQLQGSSGRSGGSHVNSPRAQLHATTASTAPARNASQPKGMPSDGPFASSPAVAAAAAACSPQGSVHAASPGAAAASPAGAATSDTATPARPSQPAGSDSTPVPSPQRVFGHASHAGPASAPASALLSPLRTPRSYREALVAGGSSPTAGIATVAATSLTGKASSSPAPDAAAGISSVTLMRTSASGAGPASGASAAATPCLGDKDPAAADKGAASSLEFGQPAGVLGSGGYESAASSEVATVPATTPATAGSPRCLHALGFTGPLAAAESQEGEEAEVPSVTAVVAPVPSSALGSGWLVASGSTSSVGCWLAAEALGRWRRAVEARRELEAKCDLLVQAARQRLAGAVLTALRDEVATTRSKEAVAEAMAAKTASRNSRQSMREVLASWRATAHRRGAVRALMARHVARTAVPLLRRVLAEWYALTAARRAVTRKVAKLTRRHREATAVRVLRAWHEEALDGAARRDTANQLASSHTRSLLSSALYGWSGATAERRARAARDMRAARHAQRRRLQGAFSRWRWAAQEATEREEVAVRVSRSMALRTAFSGWLRLASDDPGPGHVDSSTALHRAAVWHSRRVLRGCLIALLEHCERSQLLQRQMAAIKARAEDATRAAVLAHLHSAVSGARRADVEVRKMRSRTDLRLLARVFRAWLEHVEVLRSARGSAEAMGERVGRSLLAGVWEGWVGVTRVAKATREQVSAFSARSARGCVKRVFFTWLELVEARRARETHVQVAVHRIQAVTLTHVLSHWAAIATHHRFIRAAAGARFAARIRSLLSATFSAWGTLVHQLRLARNLASKRGQALKLTLLRSVLTQWVGYVERKHELAVAAAAMGARRAATVLLPAALRGWAAVVAAAREKRQLQQTMLMHFMLRRCMAEQRRAFKAWRAALEERRARDDELRRCIKRKKLAFGLFKQWYWEAFDADVQATIRRMFHSTDPAAQSPKPSMRPRFPNGAAAQPLPYFPDAVDYSQRSYGGGFAVPRVEADWQPGAWRTHAVAAAYGTAGTDNSGGRSTDLPPLEPSVDPFLRYGAASGGAVGAANAVGDPSGVAPGNLRHRLLQVQAQRSTAEPLRQPQQHTAPAVRGPSEPVRSLTPTFDSLAQHAGATSGGGATAAATAATQRTRAAAAAAANPNALRASAPAVAAGGSRASIAAAVGAASRALPAKAVYRALLHSESSSEDTGSESTKGASRPASRGRAAASVASSGGAGAGPAGGRRLSATSLGSWASNGAAKRKPAAGKSSGAPSAVAAPVPAPRRSLTGALPTQRSLSRGTATSSAAGAPSAAAPAAAAPSSSAVALAPTNSAPSSLEAMSAWNAVLANMANQLTEVSRASLEIAAGVVNGGVAGSSSPERLSPRNPAASGSAFFMPHASIERSSDSSGQQPRAAVHSSPQGGVASLPSGVTGSLSPLSPSPLPPYNVYHRSPSTGSAGHQLPGVVPSWRQVNGLYDGMYDDDLGPVNPFFAGIAGAGAAGGAGMGSGPSSGTSSGGGSDGEATLMAETDESRGCSGGGSASVPAAVASDVGTFPVPVRFPVYQNEVFRQAGDEEEEGDEDDGGEDSYEGGNMDGDGEEEDEEVDGAYERSCEDSGVSGAERSSDSGNY
ncbi:hypothetical protein Agub_g2252 [Astrephomene gubernaculifera]|uniref:Sfi1 spindle body domain-containing protein n=1 Tax=Astrephomene gubernaculifera TaxID=47775 RepID=A0AAD3HHI5_9CHLO|nr:hypothetical protein Agub_g2252 [Astrephomene gubernaculifera]